MMLRNPSPRTILGLLAGLLAAVVLTGGLRRALPGLPTPAMPAAVAQVVTATPPIQRLAPAPTPVRPADSAPPKQPDAAPSPRAPGTPLAQLSATPWPTPPPLPTREVRRPSAAHATYVDPVLGFSFSYPANWWVDPPPLPLAGPPVRGLGLTVRNFDILAFVKDERMTPEEFKVELYVQPGFSAYAGLDDYLGRERHPAPPGLAHSETERRYVAGTDARRWSTPLLAPIVPGDSVTAVLFAQGDWLYSLIAYTEASRDYPAFEGVLQSFRLPPGLPRTGAGR